MNDGKLGFCFLIASLIGLKSLPGASKSRTLCKSSRKLPGNTGTGIYIYTAPTSTKKLILGFAIGWSSWDVNNSIFLMCVYFLPIFYNPDTMKYLLQTNVLKKWLFYSMKNLGWVDNFCRFYVKILKEKNVFVYLELTDQSYVYFKQCVVYFQYDSQLFNHTICIKSKPRLFDQGIFMD